MPGDHVREKTDGERAALDKEPQGLDDEHGRDQPPRQAAGRQVLEEAEDSLLPDSGEEDEHEGAGRERGGHGDVPGGRGPEGDEAREIAGEDEEE